MAAKRLARVERGVIAEIFEGDAAELARLWHPKLLAACVDVTKAKPPPAVGWRQQKDDSFAAPPPATD